MSKKFISFKTKKLKKIGFEVIPGLTQTLAKSPTQFSEDFSPVFTDRGNGAFVTDYENNSYGSSWIWERDTSLFYGVYHRGQ